MIQGSLRRAIVTVYGLEHEWSWSLGETKWRFELTDVEESADELWLGVKCHSNPELAGFPRNALGTAID